MEIEAAVVADLGGEAELSEVRRALVADFAFAVQLRDLLASHLAATGPMTRAGKVKAAYRTWVRASQRVESLGRLLGLKRVPAKVPTLEEVMSRGD